jgi:hypothetical protein
MAPPTTTPPAPTTPPATVDDMINFVTNFFTTIAQPEYSDVADANLHTMEWIRWKDYGGFAFQRLLSVPYMDFISKANAAVTNRVDSYTDPAYNIQVHTPHIMCSMNGVFDDGGPPTVFSTNSGDFAGWGGDWCGFYANWWNFTAGTEKTGANAGNVFAATNLASDPATSPYDFHMRDWIEDADAFNIAQLLVKDATLTLPTALQQYYHPTGKAGYKTRFQDFYNGRFGGNANTAATTATSMLMAIDNIKIAAGRQVFFNKKVAFKNSFQPPDLDDTESFSLGFVTKFLALIAAEKLLP